MSMERYLIDAFKEYLDSIDQHYDEDVDLLGLVEIVRDCNTSDPDRAVGIILRNALME